MHVQMLDAGAEGPVESHHNVIYIVLVYYLNGLIL